MIRDEEQVVDVTMDGPLAQLRAVHRLTTALHQADSSVAFYEEAVASVRGLLGIDRASLLLFDPDGVMRFKAWHGLSPQYRQAVEGHTPWSPGDVDAQPILVADVDADESLAEYRPSERRGSSIPTATGSSSSRGPSLTPTAVTAADFTE